MESIVNNLNILTGESSLDGWSTSSEVLLLNGTKKYGIYIKTSTQRKYRGHYIISGYYLYKREDGKLEDLKQFYSCYEELPQITVSVFKSAAEIALEIKERFLPTYVPLFERGVDAAKKFAQLNKDKEAIALLKKLLPNSKNTNNRISSVVENSNQIFDVDIRIPVWKEMEPQFYITLGALNTNQVKKLIKTLEQI